MHPRNIYDTIPLETIRGYFCFPVNQVLRQNFAMNADIVWWEGFLGNFNLVFTLAGFSIILCGIYIALLLYFPR